MALEPELETPRARLDQRALIAASVMACGCVVAASIAIGLGQRARPAVTVPKAVPLPIFVALPAPPAPPAAIAVAIADAPAPIPPDDAPPADLSQFVERWVADPNAAPSTEPSIEYARGVVFVESAEDRGDDGPYPTSAGPEAQRVCGTASTWLRDELRDTLRSKELSCSGNACRYGGMEYEPSGEIVFREIGPAHEPGWVLVSWTQTYDAGLGPQYAQANIAFVKRALRRLADTRCAGEPAGSY